MFRFQILALFVASANSFAVGPGQKRIRPQRLLPSPSNVPSCSTLMLARPRSVVTDPDGPTPVFDQPPTEQVDPDDVDGLREIFDPSELPRPIAHQPWRRGDTSGCEAPITAQWRQDAEEVIQKAVMVTGGRVVDITWYLTTLLVTLDDTCMPAPDLLKDKGPVIEIEEPRQPMYYDPTDPDPDEIWDDEDDVLYERESEEEAAERRNRNNKMWANVNDDDPDPTESHIPDSEFKEDLLLYRNKETRTDVAGYVMDEMQLRHEENQQPIDIETIMIDTSVLSSLSYAILKALEYHEEDWRILSRHELVLSSPNPAKDVLETQRQFDEHRNHFVAVYTQDPFESNRTLKGQLVDRNAMDLILNIHGNMVTVPHVFVKCVRLPPNSAVSVVSEDDDDDDEIDGDDPELLP